MKTTKTHLKVYDETPLAPEDFSLFFREVTGHDPYPWQEALLRHVLEKEWPEAVAVPTGTGKTMVLLVAVFLMALDPRAHRRVIYVVNRRLVVDQAYDIASELKERLQTALQAQDASPLSRVARKLGALGGGVPLEVVRLRGGVPRPKPTLSDPARPAVVLATVDMAGSRLLFRGYGVSPGLLPVEGALFGVDALYLLDEAHLEAPFLSTLKAVAGLPGPWGRPGIRAVALTATPESLGGLKAFRLEERDGFHPYLRRVLSAPREARVLNSRPQNRVRDLLEQAEKLHRDLKGPVAVVVNRVERALEVYRELQKTLEKSPRDQEDPDKPKVLLLTGRMRPYERDRNFARTRELQKSLDSGEVAFVVATQALEVGADLDFAGMVTELPDLASLFQRLGRVNRRGLREKAHVVILGEEKPSLREARPYSPETLRAVWEWLDNLGAREASVNLSPEDLAKYLETRSPKCQAFGDPRTSMDLWDALMPVLAHTNPLLPIDPDPFLHGLERSAPEVEVVWRADLPVGKDAVEAYLRAVPPRPKEAVRLPLYAVRAWLKGITADFADLEGQKDVQQDDSEKEKPGGRERGVEGSWKGNKGKGRVYRFDGERVEEVALEDPKIKPGDTLLVAADLGGLSEGHWDPISSSPVPDVAEWGEDGFRLLRLHPSVLAQALGPTGVGAEDEGEILEMLVALKEDLKDAETRKGAQEIVRGFLKKYQERFRAEWRPLVEAFLHGTFEVWPWEEDVGYEGYVLRLRPENPLYGPGKPESLADHSKEVARRVEDFAQRLLLDAEKANSLRRSALWHDLGKQDPRMQYWMLVSAGGEVDRALLPLAKSGTRLTDRELARLREQAGYPPGQRHEHVAARPLLLAHYCLEAHLVATHHGRGRPLPVASQDPPGLQVPLAASWAEWPGPEKGESAHGLEGLKSGYLENFVCLLERLGPWGLAYGETLLRLADFLASGGEA